MKTAENFAHQASQPYSNAHCTQKVVSLHLGALRDYLLHSGTFSATCAFLCAVFSFHWQGAVYGMTFGALFGLFFLWLSRTLRQKLGEVFGSILIYGFSGTAAGAFAGALTKIICTPIAALVLDAIYGNTIGEPERAFYAVVYAGFLGGFFGLVKALFFDEAQTSDISDGKPIAIKEELEERSPAAPPAPQEAEDSLPPLRPRYIIPKELTQESFFSEN